MGGKTTAAAEDPTTRADRPVVNSRRSALPEPGGRRNPFDETLKEHGLFPLRAAGNEVLQVNLGRLCNQACRHCHLRAGPDRRELMDGCTAERCLDVLARSEIPVLDLTGGAPEISPQFRRLVAGARALKRRVIDRCNLTILAAPPGNRSQLSDLPEFLARHQVEIIASLPCYRKENVDAQRGEGTFGKSIQALRRLNALGYGRPGSGLVLTLAYNPLGPSLPPPQAVLEEAYRRELQSRYHVLFNRLITITNMPIGRFLDELIRRGRYESYVEELAGRFNPAAASGVMCRTMLSVDWEGRLHDCDFNLALKLGLKQGLPQHIDEFQPARLATRPIRTGQHCYGCTAGAGSSCQGATVAVRNAER